MVGSSVMPSAATRSKAVSRIANEHERLNGKGCFDEAVGQVFEDFWIHVAV